MSGSKLHVIAPSLTALLVFACGGAPKPESKASAKAEKASAPAADDAVLASAAGDGKVKVVPGQAPSADDRYELTVDAAQAKVGEPASVAVRVVPKAPWHMNLDFPTSLKVEAAAGVELAKAQLGKADAAKLDEHGCRFDVGFTASEPGERTFTGKFKFAVCQDEACAPVTRDVEFKVAVQ